MKTILVDGIHAFVIDKVGVYEPMLELLGEYPNPKIVLTGTQKTDFEKRGLNKSPYTVFTLEGNPKKSDPEYFRRLFERYNLSKDTAVFFEHNPEVVRVAESLGIKTHYYDPIKQDLQILKAFLDTNL